MTTGISRSNSSTETSSSARSDPPLQTDLLEVGRIGRPHGLRGEVTVTLVTNRYERLTAETQLETELGPLKVASARPHGQRHIVSFVDVNSREQAEALRGTVLLAAPLEDPDELWVHEMIGAEVVDQHGSSHGRVRRVLANPASDLLELANGALVPVCFVVAVTAGTRVDVEAPAGLFDINKGSVGQHAD